MSDMSLRPRSQRLTARATRLATTRSHDRPSRSTEVFPGLNDITDAFEAFPADIIKYFTLYKEIDAKYSSQLPALHRKVAAFRRIHDNEDNKAQRLNLIREISSTLAEILPCLEEKMLVASIAADHTQKHVRRINDDYELVFKHEIPEMVKFGQHNHPAIIHDAKLPDNKSAQSQRSESRREALAAKKAAHDNGSSNIEEETTPAPTTAATATASTTTTSSRGKGRPRAEKETTPAATSTKKRKTNSAQSSTATTATSIPTTATSASSNASQQSFTTNISTAPTAHAQLLGNFTASVVKDEVARPGTPANKRARTSTKKKQEQDQQQDEDKEGFYRDDDGHLHNSLGELVYCYCNQVSYGEMVGCDDNDCKREWFHLPCTGLTTLPRGKWYCDECKQKRSKK